VLPRTACFFCAEAKAGSSMCGAPSAVGPAELASSPLREEQHNGHKTLWPLYEDANVSAYTGLKWSREERQCCVVRAYQVKRLVCEWLRSPKSLKSA
jgi:hypothetical protein